MEISFDVDTYNSYLNRNISFEVFLEQVFEGTRYGYNNDDASPDQYIIERLLMYHSDEGGSPEINYFTLSEVKYNEKTHRGSLRFNYVVSYFYGCEDLNKQYDTEEQVNFGINIDSHTLTLHFNNYEKRTTFEEF